MTARWGWIAAATVGGIVALVACGGTPSPKSAKTAPGGSHDQNKWPVDDHSMCDTFVHWKSDSNLEVSETAGPGSFKPNIRRVFKSVGDRDSRHTVLLCREIDTNVDGIKDVVRTFNEKGEPLHEEADTNYDGKVDNWINFTNGTIEEEDSDTTFTTGRPNMWKFYVGGQLSRIRRNTHCASGKPDTWEIYFKNRLERVGVDLSCDGHIDRWDRDAQLAAQDDAQGVELADGGAAEGGSSPITVGANGQITDAGVASTKAKRGKK
jgi:hypothetical protein